MQLKYQNVLRWHQFSVICFWTHLYYYDINQVISYWPSWMSGVSFIGQKPKTLGQYSWHWTWNWTNRKSHDLLHNISFVDNDMLLKYKIYFYLQNNFSMWHCSIKVTMHPQNLISSSALYYTAPWNMQYSKWATAWDFQQCGMSDNSSLRSACIYAQSDQSLRLSLEYSMSVKLLTEQRLELLSLTGGCTGWSECTHVKMPHCWKSHVTAQMCLANVHLGIYMYGK